MPRGLPDYYNPDTLVSQRLANVEEVVTQLRGVASIDNRGRTLIVEKFDETLARWLPSSTGDGSDPVISTAQAYIPPSSAYFNCGTSGGSGNSTLLLYFHLGASKKLGFETAIHYSTAAPVYDFQMRYNLDGTAYLCRWRINPASGDLSIETGGAFTIVGNVGWNAQSVGAWMPVKIVGDFENGIYQRLLVGQAEIDISAYPMVATAIDRPGYADFIPFIDATNAVTNDAYLGVIQITVDEP